jgi:hypothetical protein
MTLRIHFERTGGFAGPAARRTATVDADALPATEAEELRKLVQQADVAALATPSATGGTTRPDAFRYRLVIDTDGQQHAVSFSDTDMPAAIRPLVSWLTKRASPGSR